MMSYPTAIGGHPIVILSHSDPDNDSINEKVLVVKTSAQSINRNHGSYDRGGKIVSPRYHDGWFPLVGPY
jgi:hypothetical protein